MRLIALLLALAGLALATTAKADPVFQSSTYACTRSAQYAGTAGTVKLVSGTATQGIYVCGFAVTASAASTFQLEYGTGSNCGTGATTITPAFSLPANGSLVDHQTYYAGIPAVPPGNDLCVVIGTGPAPDIVYYTQF